MINGYVSIIFIIIFFLMLWVAFQLLLSFLVTFVSFQFLNTIFKNKKLVLKLIIAQTIVFGSLG